MQRYFTKLKENLKDEFIWEQKIKIMHLNIFKTFLEIVLWKKLLMSTKNFHQNKHYVLIKFSTNFLRNPIWHKELLYFAKKLFLA